MIRSRRITLVLSAALLAACGGDAEKGGRAAAPPDTTWANRRVWTPGQQRTQNAIDSAAADAVPATVAGPNVVPQPGPAADQDSAQWAADEARKFQQRTASMESYASCMGKARDVPQPTRARIEAACARLPTAPR
ncbi:MAG TPA: hypothetical protein VEX86_24290 [Longimicrobium sp.]|nr:hypothetical protein [Longimicrobium sp.]